MTSEEWLKHLAPGTLIYRRDIPDDGFYLVYHVEVEEYPGPWRQLHVWVLDAKRCKLRMFNVESSTFQNKWAIAIDAY